MSALLTRDVVRLSPRGLHPLAPPREAHGALPDLVVQPVPPAFAGLQGTSPVLLDRLRLEWLGPGEAGEGAWMVVDAVRYRVRDARVPREFAEVTVPAGFVSDLATLGRGGLLACAVLDVDPDVMAAAAVVHDYLRGLAGTSGVRLHVADEYFRAVLEATSGEPTEKTEIAYLAVRGHALTKSRAWQWAAKHVPPLALALLRRLL